MAAALAVVVLATSLRRAPEFDLATAAAVSLVNAAWAELSRADPAA